MSANEIAGAAREVVKYWRDWPQSRRDSVAALSQFLAAALNDLAVAVVWRQVCAGSGVHPAVAP